MGIFRVDSDRRPVSSGGQELTAEVQLLRRARGTKEPEVEIEKYEKGGESACGVEERVPGRSGTRGNERLVEFVENRIDGGDEPCGESPRPVPAVAASADAATKEQIENEVFGEVGGLADQKMDDVDAAVGNGWDEPAEQGLEYEGSVGRREGVCGSEKDQPGPEKDGPPDVEPCRSERSVRNAVADLVEVGCGARVTPGFGGRHSGFSIHHHCKGRVKGVLERCDW